MSTKVVILQSNYIPWKGYFDLINMADVFIFYDDVQYTKNDWRNRNKIKVPNGTRWLTIPCGSDLNRMICQVEIKDRSWQENHWRSIVDNYKQAPFFRLYKNLFEDFYMHNEWLNLSDLNQYIIKKISTELLGVKTIFEDSRKYNLQKSKGERVIELLEKVEATKYLSGPAGKAYLDKDEFKKRNIELAYIDYSNYPEYEQLYPPFIHEVSIIDLIFNKGENAKKYMKSFISYQF